MIEGSAARQKNESRKFSSHRLVADLCATILIVVAIAASHHASASAVDQPGVFDLSNTDVTAYDPATNQVIGQGHYKVTHVDGADLVEGENKYLNGEFDRETQRVEHTADGSPPVLVTYQHAFFNADGSPEYTEELDSKAGTASCKRFTPTPDIRETKVDIPPDTYAGSTQLMLLVGRLRQGAREIKFHSFNCLPGPRMIPQLEMVPDLGWLNTIAAPFIPKVYGWFDPSDKFNYVGGKFSRFYKGREVLMVRMHGDKPSAAPSPAKP
jgi:hypothetical protein